MTTVEKSAKTVDQAVAEAVKALGVTEADVSIEIVDEGSKGGLFGFGAKPATVKVSLKNVDAPKVEATPVEVAPTLTIETPAIDPEPMIKSFLAEVLQGMGLDMEFDMVRKDKRIHVTFVGEGTGILIGKRGQTIDSLQYLTNLTLNGKGVRDVNVILDANGYRKRRRDTLEALARSISRKVRDTRQSVKLEPMSRFERHVIHTALQNNKDVSTQSEGNEPHRYIVVSPVSKRREKKTFEEFYGDE